MANPDQHAQAYAALTARLQQLRERHAVAVSREEAKDIEREKALTALKAAGVNVDDLPGELVRLETELQAELNHMTAAVEQFAADLTVAEQKQAAVAAGPQGVPA